MLRMAGIWVVRAPRLVIAGHVISSLKTSRDATTVPNRSRPERTSGFAHVFFKF